jgi:hypothetical protein
MALPGCGSNNSSPTPGGPGGIPGSPGYIGGNVVTPIGGGAGQITFTGSNVYYASQNFISGGMPGAGGTPSGNGCSLGNCFCGLFPAQDPVDSSGRYYTGSYSYGQGFPACWQFTNYNHSNVGTGVVVAGSGGIQVGAPGSTTYFGSSAMDPGTGVTVVATPIGDGYHANVTGTLTLSPAFIQRNFGGAMPQIQGLVFDFTIPQAGAIYGGIILSTGGGHGAFVRL